MAKAVEISQQPHSIESLILGPIQAIIEAQSISKQRSIEFLEEVGFEPHSIHEGRTKFAGYKLKMVEFLYDHPVPDPQNPGQVIDTPTYVKLPLLSLISTPNIDISEATVDFNIKVVGFQTKDEKSKTSKKKLPFSIQSVYASRSKPVKELDQEPHTISISLKLQKEPPSEAEIKINNLLNDAIIAHPLEEKSKK